MMKLRMTDSEGREVSLSVDEIMRLKALVAEPSVRGGFMAVPVVATREIESAIGRARNLKASEIWECALAAVAEPEAGSSVERDGGIVNIPLDLLRDFIGCSDVRPGVSRAEWEACKKVVMSYLAGSRVVEQAFSGDREMLMYLMERFDNEEWVCPMCSHSETTADMDSAGYLREYLAGEVKPKPEEKPLPYWPACNPGCDPEFNGERSRFCGTLCRPAREALAAADAVDPKADAGGMGNALRQYRHNTGEGFVFGYDRDVTDKYVHKLLGALKAIEQMSYGEYSLKNAVLVARNALGMPSDPEQKP